MTGLAGLDWIAVDWGTTRLRVWAMDRAGQVLAQAASDRGIATLDRAGHEAALLALIGGWLPDPALVQGRLPVLACGMVGSRQGWIEAPYRAVPCLPLVADGLVAAPVADPRLAVWLVPGLMQAQAADVMRGEEVQIAGFLAAAPDFDGVLCLPGTHAKWVRISAGEVVSFQTFMTGELFALLSERSVLRHGMAGEGWEETAFDAGVEVGLARPERLAARLFSIRAEGLLQGLTPGAARARLSGLLIGAELAGAKPYWLGQDVAIVGAGVLTALYGRALAQMGVQVRQYDGGTAVLAGLTAARAILREKEK